MEPCADSMGIAHVHIPSCFSLHLHAVCILYRYVIFDVITPIYSSYIASYTAMEGVKPCDL